MKKNACRPAYIRPPRLREGDRTALIATASPASEKQLAEAVRSLKELNLSPVVFPSCRAQKEYLSGDDRLRAHDLMLAFSDPGIRAIFCLRGGYGSARLLDLLDYNTIRQNPKIFAGFSDVTALHAAFAKHCGFITYHAPMPSYPCRKYDRHITLASLQVRAFFGKRILRAEKSGIRSRKNGQKRILREQNRRRLRSRHIRNGNRRHERPTARRQSDRLCLSPGHAVYAGHRRLYPLSGRCGRKDISHRPSIHLPAAGRKTERMPRHPSGHLFRLHPAAPQPALLSGDHKGDRVVCRACRYCPAFPSVTPFPI